MAASLSSKVPELSLVEPITGLESFEIEGGRGVIGVVYSGDEEDPIIEGASWTLETKQFGSQTIVFRVPAGSDEGLSILHTINGEVGNTEDPEQSVINLIKHLSATYQEVQISIFNREWISPYLRSRYDILIEHPEAQNAKGLHILHLEQREKSFGVLVDEINAEPPIPKNKIPPASGLLMILSHEDHINNRDVNDLLQTALDHSPEGLFGSEIGDEDIPRYENDGMVFSLSDFRITRNGIVEIPLEFGFRTTNRSLCCLSANETGLFQAISDEIRNHQVNQTNFLGCGSLSCFIISKLIRRYHHIIDNSSDTVVRYHQRLKHMQIPSESKVDEQIVAICDDIVLIEKQIERASRIYEGLGELAEIEKSIFENRNPLDPLSQGGKELAALTTKIEGLKRELDLYRERTEEARLLEQERKLKIVDKVFVVAAGVIGIPIMADFFEKVMERAHPFLAWSIATAGFIFTAASYYIAKLLMKKKEI